MNDTPPNPDELRELIKQLKQARRKTEHMLAEANRAIAMFEAALKSHSRQDQSAAKEEHDHA